MVVAEILFEGHKVQQCSLVTTTAAATTTKTNTPIQSVYRANMIISRRIATTKLVRKE